jgi:hypothetical protein
MHVNLYGRLYQKWLAIQPWKLNIMITLTAHNDFSNRQIMSYE